MSCAGFPPREDTSSLDNGQSLPLGTVTVTTAEGHLVKYTVEVADSDPERMRGMMFRKSIDPQAGMLFLFDLEERQAFWMKNTYVSLDIVFIGADWRIAGIVPNAEPLSSKLLYVNKPSRFVLEIAAGESEKWGFSQGDVVEFRANE